MADLAPNVNQLEADRAAKVADATARQAAFGQETQGRVAAENAAMAPLEAGVLQAEAGLQGLTPPKPSAVPAFKPQPIVDAKDYQQFATGLIAMALIGGAVSRGNWLGVSSTLNGALKGYLEGDQAKAEKSYKDYQQQYEAAQAHDKAAQKEFEDILQSKTLSINSMLAQVKIAAAKYGREDIRLAAEQKSIDTIWRQVEDYDKALVNASLSKEKIDLQVKKAQDADGGGFGGRIQSLLATLTDEGASLPAGFRSKAQMSATLKGLIEKHPDETDEQIVQRIKEHQIEFGAEKKETQTAAGIAGRVGVANNEITQFAPLVREASKKVPRGQFVPITELLQRGEASFSNPQLKDLRIKINSLLNAYDILAGRGGTDKAKREEVRSLLTSADSPEALEIGLKAFEQEALAAGRAAKQAEKGSGAEEPMSLDDYLKSQGK